MLGLVRSGRLDLVRDMLDNFAYLIGRFAHVPNGNRTYYLSRSQPPFFAAMVGLYAAATDTAQALRYLPALETEHAFWMDGAGRLAPGRAYRRVVELPDGSVLNRYWDDRAEPRPEAYREDARLAARVPGRGRETLYRNLRASAESGWDFSSRWLRDPADLANAGDDGPRARGSQLPALRRRAADRGAARVSRRPRRRGGRPELRRRRGPPSPSAARRRLRLGRRLLLRRALAHGRACHRPPHAGRRGPALFRARRFRPGPGRRRAPRAGLPPARRVRHDAHRVGAAVGRAERVGAAGVDGDRGTAPLRAGRARRYGRAGGGWR